MYARCPNCQTIFEVNDDVLNARVGMARCGVCRVTFNASWNLVDQLPGVDLPTAVRHPQSTEPEVMESDAPAADVASPEPEPEPEISERITEPVASESVASPVPVDAEPFELVSEEIEIESVSILKEVERLDDALSRKQGSPQEDDYDQTTNLDAPGKEFAKTIIPEHEIVLETSAEAWQQLGPDVKPEPSALDHERISTSVDRMRAMLNPVTEPETDSEESSKLIPAAVPPVAERRALRRTELPPELDPLRDGGIEGAAGDAGLATLPEIYAGPEVDANEAASRSSAIAWRGVAWFLGLVSLSLTILWQIREFYLDDLAQFPAIRPALSEFCEFTACAVPPRRDPRLIDLVGTNVETHPAVPGALRVVVSLINRADYSQLPPLLEVTLSNRTGGVAGRRTYTFSDYVTNTDDANLEPNVVSNITIDLAAPSESAVGYEIQLIPD